ncbi:putative serine/threonine-protein kinase [Hordeum vulgare]|nr:putative serine/threonine-protein kinase [Hordeum vulgare]
MDDDFEAAVAIASMASSVAVAKARGKAHAPSQGWGATQEEEGVDARGAGRGVGQEEGPEAHVGCKGRGVKPSQHGLINAAVVAATTNTGSSTYPRMMLPESPRVSCTQSILGFHVYRQGNRFSRECLPEVSIVAPSTTAPVTIDLNTVSVAGGSSSGGMRKCEREMPTDMLTKARNLFDEMPSAVDDDTANRFLENMIFEDQIGLDDFPLDHEFPEDYGLEEEDDDVDIDGEPLFEEEFANQTAVGVKPERKSKRTKA